MKPETQGGDKSMPDASRTVPLEELTAPVSPPTRSETVAEASPRIPDHKLLRCIGRGAYGEVWLARTVLGEFRAVKLVYRNKFEHDRPYEREFEGIRKFEPISREHESQVDILHVGRDEQAGYFYYVMELADDAGAETELSTAVRNSAASVSPSRTFSADTYIPHTLKLALHRRKRLPVDECIEIGLALITALDQLHGHGLLHRDIKPSNIIFIKGVPKLGDIGLVASMDATMSFVGTAGFLPPEGPGTPQGDIYSLGKVLYEMCMGRDRQEFPKLPPDLSQLDDPARLLELNAVILKACHTNPRERYQSARDMGAELALLQRGKSVKHRRTVERRWAAARKLGIAASVLAVALAALPILKPQKGYTPTPEVAGLYKLAQWHYNQLTPEDHVKASNYLAQVLQSDPKFIKPYAELVMLYTWCWIGIPTEQERLQKVRMIADKLMVIAPGSAEYHAALSLCSYVKRDWRGAEDEIVRSIKVNPDLPITRHMYSFYLTMQGKVEEAHRQAQRGVELEPASRTSAIIAAWPFIAERRFDRAIAQLQRVIGLDRNFALGHMFLGICYEAQSNYVAAIEEYKASCLLEGGDPSRTAVNFAALRQAYDTGGEQGYLRKVVELIQTDSIPVEEKFFAPIDLAAYYAKLGEKQKALDALEKHFHKPNGWQRLNHEVLYDNIRDEPRFKALLKLAGFEQ